MEAHALRGLQLPLIRTKRHHRKSRLGCLRCKERRVKCDETRPSCTGCAVRLATCVYSGAARQTEPRARSDGSAHEDNSPSDTTSENSPRLITSGKELEVSDTELAECYLNRVSYSFGNDDGRPERDWVWHVHIPSLALSFSTVRDGMYALAAIFMHFSEDQRSTKYVDAANFYGTRFVEASRKQLARLDSSECNANMVCAKLLFVLGLAFHREYRRTGFLYSNPMMWSWVHMLSGIKAIHHGVLQSGQALHPTMLLDMTHHMHKRSDSSRSEAEAVAPEFHHLKAFIKETQHERSTALRTLVLNRCMDLDEQQQADCLDAIQILHKATEQIQSVDREDVIRVLGACITHMPNDFLSMLEQQNDVALSIYAHWLLMLMLTEDLWVVDDMGRAGIDAILDTVHRSETEHALSFPRKALSSSRIPVPSR